MHSVWQTKCPFLARGFAEMGGKTTDFFSPEFLFSVVRPTLDPPFPGPKMPIPKTEVPGRVPAPVGLQFEKKNQELLAIATTV